MASDEYRDSHVPADGTAGACLRPLLVKWSNHAKSNAAMHDLAWSYCRRWNIASMIPAMVLVSISGISTIGIGQSPTCGRSVALTILGVLGVLGGTLVAINRFMGYSELQQQHDFYSDSYTILHRDIRFNLAVSGTPHAVFTNEVEYMKHCKSRLDTLLDRAPAIPPAVRRKLDRLRSQAAQQDHDSLRVVTRRGSVTMRMPVEEAPAGGGARLVEV